MKTTPWIAIATLLLAGACGGGDAADGDDTTAGGEEEHHHGGGHHEHGEHEHDGSQGHEHAMNAGLRAFHDRFAPVYHMDPGAERAAAACDAATDFTRLAADVDTAPAEGLDPESDEYADAVGADAQTAANSLAEECEGAEEMDEATVGIIDQRLESLHDAFHHAMEEWRASHPDS